MRDIMPLWALWRCAFLYLFDYPEEKKGRGHNATHNAQAQTVVGSVVIWCKPLENLNKGGFCHA
jgi:hypothetical protein